MEESLELSFTISNRNLTKLRVLIFGGNISLSLVNFGNQAGITITPDFGVSYLQVLRDTIKSPFTIGKIRMQSIATPEQVVQGISVISTDIYGDRQTEAIPMITSIDEYQEQLGIAVLEKSINMTGDVALQFDILASTTVLFTVFIKRKINSARILGNLNPMVAYKDGGTLIKPLLLK